MPDEHVVGRREARILSVRSLSLTLLYESDPPRIVNLISHNPRKDW